MPADVATALSILEDDYTELWFLVAELQKTHPEASLAQLSELAQQLVVTLLREHGVQLLDSVSEQPMLLPIAQVRALVDDWFRTLGRVPDIGDGIWLGKPSQTEN
ncbi:hypothetical protein [Hymenobacter negativus]|uniref:Uncharacterized protein n=1 Tax=Hymenobacter negativus TaxID=2795026 RepID=A0ABS0Q4A2_9BACT|nr:MULTISPECIES: hypothetical protein [Bacteria]MBH8557468.1 hypothetical protein [Hymenobacter negativus]MBH8567998.1 hypothetical protein [Hymenobacter negativus]MBR7207734.1 hypothetical protein [Microvirga sp. STS02]